MHRPAPSRARSRAERLVAVVTFPGVTLLDVAAPLQVLDRLGRPFRTVLVAARAGPVPTDTPVALSTHTTFDDLPEPAAVVVPGGGLGVFRAMVDPAVARYLNDAGRRAGVVGSVCTGSLLLAGAGLLEGRRAATHWGYAALLERLGVLYLPEAVVEDGPFVTAAGGSAGIDMALRLAARLAGQAASDRIASALAVAPAAPAAHGPGGPGGGLLAHLPRAEAIGRLASMRLILAERPELRDRLAL